MNKRVLLLASLFFLIPLIAYPSIRFSTPNECFNEAYDASEGIDSDAFAYFVFVVTYDDCIAGCP